MQCGVGHFSIQTPLGLRKPLCLGKKKPTPQKQHERLLSLETQLNFLSSKESECINKRNTIHIVCICLMYCKYSINRQSQKILSEI